MRKTRSTRTNASDGSSDVAIAAFAAAIELESPGMSKRAVLPVVCAVFKPVRIKPDVVSNAAVPGRPAVSFDGNVSFTNCQMSDDTEPIAAALPALAWPGEPGRSTYANATLSQ